MAYSFREDFRIVIQIVIGAKGEAGEAVEVPG
jgi:hypothetical protein